MKRFQTLYKCWYLPALHLGRKQNKTSLSSDGECWENFRASGLSIISCLLPSGFASHDKTQNPSFCAEGEIMALICMATFYFFQILMCRVFSWLTCVWFSSVQAIYLFSNGRCLILYVIQPPLAFLFPGFLSCGQCWGGSIKCLSIQNNDFGVCTTRV